MSIENQPEVAVKALSSGMPLLGVFLIVLAIGVVFSVSYASVNAGLGETGRVAVSLLTEQTLSNPYVVPTGPSGHVSPITAGLIAMVFAVFGIGTAETRIALGAVSAVAYAASVVIAVDMLERMRVRRSLIVTASVVLALVPLRLFDAVVYLRQWDQPLAALFLMSAWWLVMRMKETGPSVCSSICFGGVAGVGALTSPSLIPAFLIGLMIVFWQARVPRPHARAAMLLGALTVSIAVLLPWTVRNKIELGVATPARSNFGLELLVGNGILEEGDEQWIWDRERQIAHVAHALREIHPFQSSAAASRVRELGEAQFMRVHAESAWALIRENPGAFVLLSLSRASTWLFPPRALVDWSPFFGTLGPWLWGNLVGIALLAAICTSIAIRERRAEILTFVTVPMLPYFITHMNMRYSYLVYFPAMVAIFFCIEALGRRRDAGR